MKNILKKYPYVFTMKQAKRRKEIQLAWGATTQCVYITSYLHNIVLWDYYVFTMKQAKWRVRNIPFYYYFVIFRSFGKEFDSPPRPKKIGILKKVQSFR